MINTIEFTAGLIKNRQTALRESLKSTKKESKTLKESCEEKKVLKEDDEEEVEDIIEEPVEDVVEEEPVEAEEEVIEDAEGFEETIEDTVYFCPVCDKHFIASPDTADDDVQCPVCGEMEVLIDMGTAEEALDEEENAEVAVELDDIAEEAPEAEEEAVPAEDEIESFDFDEDDLEEGLRLLAKKHLSEKSVLRIRSGKIVEGNLVLTGRLLPQKRTFKVTFEGFSQAMKESKRRFILEGSTDLFKSSKLKGLFVKEGSKVTVKKCGYGILKEAKKGYVKVKGLLG